MKCVHLMFANFASSSLLFGVGVALFSTAPTKNAGTSGSGAASLAVSSWSSSISWTEELQEGSKGSFGGMIHSTCCWRSLHHSSSCSMPSLPFSLFGALMAPWHISGPSIPPDCSAHSWVLRTLLRHSTSLCFSVPSQLPG